jgi:putative iron-regulated protein
MIKFLICLLLPILTFAKAAPIKTFAPEAVAKFLDQYSELVTNNYKITLEKTTELENEIKNFLRAPSEENLNKAKMAWIAARKFYSKTEAYRFYGGPIDADETGPEGFINSWPIDESYIDYVKGNPTAGIINQKEKFPKINSDLLRSLNTKDGESNVATGYHAVEFLLWGQDLNKKGPGQRSFTDYLSEKNENAERRQTYLKVVMEILLQDLETVYDHWKNGSYLKELKKETPALIIQKIMTGLTTLAFDEMSGERMTVAIAKKDQENEQDCFSDNSLNDIAANQEGILEVFEQTGLKDLFSETKMLTKISSLLKKNLELLQSFKASFDQIVLNTKHPERAKVNKLILQLQQQARLMNQLGKLYGLELNVQ